MRVRILLAVQNAPNYALIEVGVVVFDSLLCHITGEFVATQLEEMLLQKGEQVDS